MSPVASWSRLSIDVRRDSSSRCNRDGSEEWSRFMGFPPNVWFPRCGNSGTTMRLLMGLLAGYEGSFELSGDARCRNGPMSRVATPLRAMGAVIDRDNAPLTIEGTCAPRD